MSPLMSARGGGEDDAIGRALAELAKLDDPKTLAAEWAKLQTARDEIAAEKHQAEIIRTQQLNSLGAIVTREIAVGERETAVRVAHQANITASGNLATFSEILEGRAGAFDERERRLNDREVSMGDWEANKMRGDLLLEGRQEKLNARQALLDGVIASIQAAVKTLGEVEG